MSGFNEISHDTNDAIEYDLAIVCDCSNMDRLKDFSVYFKNAKNQFLIDHHETNNINVENAVVDPDCPATCQLVYDLLDREYIDKKVAECIYIGIAHDTGVFRYSSTNKRTFEIAGELIEKNIDFTDLLDKTMFMKSFQQKKIEAMIIERAKFLCGGKVLFGYVTSDELDYYSLTKKDVDAVVVSLRETENIKMAVFAYQQTKTSYKISLRSNGEKINCADIAKVHEGGGHKKAAGFTLNMPLNEIIKLIDKELAKII